MATKASKRTSQQRAATLRLLLLAGILVCINLLASRFHGALDLTREKRFTLSPATKHMLRDLEDVVVIDVYLHGKLPSFMQRLRDATREKLQSFQNVGGRNIVYRFRDPFEGKNESEKMAVAGQLAQKGIAGVQLSFREEDEGYAEKIVYPFALVQYKGQSTAVNLLENHRGITPQGNLSYSETLLEYKIGTAIHKLKYPAPIEVAYLMGNGQPLGTSTFDALSSLEGIYRVDTIDLKSTVNISSVYKAVIIAKPTQPFDDKDKFKIDQYVMRGGKVLWLIDKLQTFQDSLTRSQQFITTEYDLNLDDILFRYGVRINADLVEDATQALPIPIITGMVGNEPRMELRPWIYYPVFMPSSSHPIVNNLGAVMSEYANSIDTIADPEIRKTILLESGKYSRTEPNPVRVNLNMLKYPIPPERFQNPYRPVAVLMEGRFRSIFANRIPASFMQVLDSLKLPFKPVADTATSMIVVADGEMFENKYSQQEGLMEVGYWPYSNERYANKDFLLNCLDYLTDPNSLLEARSKDVRVRLLDKGRARDERVKWQFINIGIPVALVLIFASAYLFFRKRRYEEGGKRSAEKK